MEEKRSGQSTPPGYLLLVLLRCGGLVCRNPWALLDAVLERSLPALLVSSSDGIVEILEDLDNRRGDLVIVN